MTTNTMTCEVTVPSNKNFIQRKVSVLAEKLQWGCELLVQWLLKCSKTLGSLRILYSDFKTFLKLRVNVDASHNKEVSYKVIPNQTSHENNVATTGLIHEFTTEKIIIQSVCLTTYQGQANINFET